MTDRALDVALLEENHLFQIQVADDGIAETQYTRDGSFYLNPINDQSVMLTTKDGHPVLGDNGPIVIPNGFTDVRIESNGQVVITRNNQPETVGQLNIVEAVLPRTLEATGSNAYRLPDLMALGLNAEDIIQNVLQTTDIVKSGALEQSNVDFSKQITDMMMTQKSYQFNARTISMGDQMLGLINQLR